MDRMKPRRSKNRGSALALVLVALILLLVVGGGLLSLGLNGRMLAVRAASETGARCAADAGLSKALFDLNENLKLKNWNDSKLPGATGVALPNCEATFSYTVTVDSNSVYSIESIGSCGRAQRSVNSTLRLKTPFEYALFTQGKMLLRTGTTIDGYNYGAGGENLKIGTNSTEAGAIMAKTGVTIEGDVLVGAGGDTNVVIDSMKEATVTGDAYPLTESNKLHPINVPKELVLSPSKGIISGSTTISSSGKYDGLKLGNGEIVTVDKPVKLYVPGDLILDNSAQIQVVADANTGSNGSLTLYLGGNLVSQNGGFINNLTKNAKRVKVYGLDTCQAITFKTNSIFYGAIYAPNADVQLHSKVEIFGSVIGESFTQDVNANFHYDASLRQASVSDEVVYFVIERWREE